MKVKLKIVLEVEKFSFGPGDYEVSLRYKTLGTSPANAFIPGILQTASRTKPNMMRVRDDIIEFNLADIGKNFPFLLAEYKGSEDGLLKASFAII